MLDIFENAVFVFAAVVIILLAVGICIAGTPSTTILADLPPAVTVTDPDDIWRIEELVFTGTDGKKPEQNIYRRGKGNILIPGTGLDKDGRKRYLGPFRYENSNPEKTYTLLDKRYRKKYSNFQDAYQLALMAESVLRKDENGLDIIEITYVTPGSVIGQIGLKKGDCIYSICGYPVKSESDALYLFQELKKLDVFHVEIIRNGQPMIMNFRFK